MVCNLISDIINMSSTLGCGNRIHKADLVKKKKNHVSLTQLQFQLTHYSLCFKRPRYLLKLPVTKTQIPISLTQLNETNCKHQHKKKK